MSTISVVISAFNEEKNIRSCLQSVSWADELIVVDNTSTDKTAKIAKDCGATVYKRKNNPMLNVNKNYGFGKTTMDWVLNLDADEIVEEDLAREIQSIISNEHEESSGFEIPRKNIIFQKWIQHAGWYPDYQIRLFRKGKGKFEEKHVHEKIRVQGTLKKLSGHIIHKNYKTMSHFLSKLDLYTSNEAQNLIDSGYHFNKLDCIRLPKSEFISRYFAQEGYKDGLHGLVLSFLMSFYHLVVFVKLWERQQYKRYDVSLSELEDEIGKASDESIHWMHSVVGNSSIFKRFRLKLRKIL